MSPRTIDRMALEREPSLDDALGFDEVEDDAFDDGPGDPPPFAARDRSSDPHDPVFEHDPVVETACDGRDPFDVLDREPFADRRAPDDDFLDQLNLPEDW